jgi:hypothetical protein
MNPAPQSHLPLRPTALAHLLLGGVIRAGDWAIDATAGNGHDTEFLAGCVGELGKVLAFDVQAAAIASARERVQLAGMGGQVEFFLESHSELGRHAGEGSVAVVMFNLGYLPGQDHGLTTEPEPTLLALQAACKVLRSGGILSVICYPGHPVGADEAAAVEAWACGLAREGWRVARYGAIGTRRPAPFLLWIAKPV